MPFFAVDAYHLDVVSFFAVYLYGLLNSRDFSLAASNFCVICVIIIMLLAAVISAITIDFSVGIV